MWFLETKKKEQRIPRSKQKKQEYMYIAANWAAA